MWVARYVLVEMGLNWLKKGRRKVMYMVPASAFQANRTMDLRTTKATATPQKKVQHNDHYPHIKGAA